MKSIEKLTIQEETLYLLDEKIEEILRPLFKIVEFLNININSPKGLRICFDSFIGYIQEAAFANLMFTVIKGKDKDFIKQFEGLLTQEEAAFFEVQKKEYEEFKRNMN